MILLFWGFNSGADSISKEAVRFSPFMVSLRKKLCSLSLVFDCCACILSIKDPNIMLA